MNPCTLCMSAITWAVSSQYQEPKRHNGIPLS